jgi:hypothetical protein
VICRPCATAAGGSRSGLLDVHSDEAGNLVGPRRATLKPDASGRSSTPDFEEPQYFPGAVHGWKR